MRPTQPRRVPWRRAGFVLLAAACVAGLPGKAQTSVPATKQDAAATPNAEQGKRLFLTYGCYQCHGYAAQGGVGPRLGPSPVPYPVFLHYVRHPSGTMPVYTDKVVSDQELLHIYTFLKSLPEAPKPKDVPQLNQ
jgi:mono/diheme cytochrome c family protein